MLETRPLSVKLVPPNLPPWYVTRPELERRLDEARDYRLTAVVAGAGYGKSTHVAARAQAHGWAWYTVDSADASLVALARGISAALRRVLPDLQEPVLPPSGAAEDRAVADALAAAISSGLDEVLTGGLVLVVDDVHELGRVGAGGGLLEGLTRYVPPGVHLVFCSREEPPFSIARLRGRGEVLDVSSAELAFDADEVQVWLASRMGEEAAVLARSLHELSGGWPAALNLAAEMLAPVPPADRAAALRALAERSGPLFGYLAEEVFAREPGPVKELLRLAAHFERLSPGLCAELGIEAAADLLDGLARRGFLSEASAGAEKSYALHALVRDFVRAMWPANAGELRDLHRRASRWYLAEGRWDDALRHAVASGADAAVRKLLAEHGDDVLDAGDFDAVIAAEPFLRPDRADGWLTLVRARIVRGEWEQALRLLESVDAPAAFLAFHLALVHEARGDWAAALEAMRPNGLDICDDAMHLAFVAHYLHALGRLDEAREYSHRAYDAARIQGDTSPHAEAHLTLTDSLLDEGHLAEAERHAIACRDIFVRIGNVLGECSGRSRLTTIYIAQGRYDEALAEATAALEHAERIGFSLFQGWLPSNRGEAQLASGRLDEAFADLSAAVRHFELMGSHSVAGPLAKLGDVHLARGEAAQARSAYERAFAAAEQSGSAGELARPLLGLARLTADVDLDEAARLANRALAVAPPRLRVAAELSVGWVALHRGELGETAAAAETALAEATRRGEPARIAESLELQAAAAGDPAGARRLLEEAAAIWRRLGNELAEAAAVVALAHIEEGAAPVGAERAERVLLDAGIKLPAVGAGLLATVRIERQPPLAVQTLGRFAILRDGVPVPAGEWQSKKARDLLKLLVARRGRVATREFLIEALWPEEDPKKTSNRLSVALNVVRSVLDPDGRFAHDHFVAGDREGVRVVAEHLAVDVESFLDDAEAALRRYREGPAEEALQQLAAAEAAYRGEFLEEDRYEDWAAPLRDEARSAYLEVARALTASAKGTIRYHLRLLAVDAYDEDTHLDLVSLLAQAGRHGEARRAYRSYVARMGEIGVEPTAFPALAADEV